MEGDLKDFKEKFSTLSYLSTLDDSKIGMNYRDLISLAGGSNSLSELSEDNLHFFYDLKMKQVKESLAANKTQSDKDNVNDDSILEMTTAKVDGILSFFGGFDGLHKTMIDLELLKRKKDEQQNMT